MLRALTLSKSSSRLSTRENDNENDNDNDNENDNDNNLTLTRMLRALTLSKSSARLSTRENDNDNDNENDKENDNDNENENDKDSVSLSHTLPSLPVTRTDSHSRNTILTRVHDSSSDRVKFVVTRRSMPLGFDTRQSTEKVTWGEFNETVHSNTLQPAENNKMNTFVYASEPANAHRHKLFVSQILKKGIGSYLNGLNLSSLGNSSSYSDDTHHRNKSFIPSHDSQPNRSEQSIVVLETSSCVLLRPTAPHVCSVTMVLKMEDKGNLPFTVLSSKVVAAVGIVGCLKAYYERKGSIVDSEIRSQFVKFNIPSMIMTPNVELESFAKRQMAKISSISKKKKWEKMEKEGDQPVHISTIHIPGENSGTVKAEFSTDTTPENVLAWFWDYCSNERLSKISKLEKNPKDVVNLSPNHAIFSSIKQLPWPMGRIHLILETTWFKMGVDEYVFAWRSIDESDMTHEAASAIIFDSRDKNKARGNRTKVTVTGFVIISKQSEQQLVEDPAQSDPTLRDDHVTSNCLTSTKLIYVTTMGASSVPSALLNLSFVRSVNSVLHLRELFEQDALYDSFLRTKVSKVMRSEAPQAGQAEDGYIRNISYGRRGIHGQTSDGETQLAVGPHIYSEQESLFLQNMTKIFGSLPASEEFTPMQCTDSMTKFFSRVIVGKTFIRATTILDAPVEEVAAYNFALGTREREKKRGRFFRKIETIDDHNLTEYKNVDVGFGVSRSLILKHIWMREKEGSMLHYTEDAHQATVHPTGRRGSFRTRRNSNTKRNSISPLFNRKALDNKNLSGPFVTLQSCARFKPLYERHMVGSVDSMTSGSSHFFEPERVLTTEVTFTATFHLGGILPPVVSHNFGSHLLNEIVAMRKLFNKDREVDSSTRNAIIRSGFEKLYSNSGANRAEVSLVYWHQSNQETNHLTNLQQTNTQNKLT